MGGGWAEGLTSILLGYDNNLIWVCFKIITWVLVNQPTVLACLLHTGTKLSLYSTGKYSPSNHYVNSQVFNFLNLFQKSIYPVCRL